MVETFFLDLWNTLWNLGPKLWNLLMLPWDMWLLFWGPNLGPVMAVAIPLLILCLLFSRAIRRGKK